MKTWCQDVKDFIKEVGRKLVEMTGDVRALSILRQRISLAIQRGMNSLMNSSKEKMPQSKKQFFCFLCGNIMYLGKGEFTPVPKNVRVYSAQKKGQVRVYSAKKK
uniref:Uncharacterized protein n=1 Tax=Cacopsylla melanoneura TaxID=428564 RepID=A0A8D8TFA7_9HEMI